MQGTEGPWGPNPVGQELREREEQEAKGADRRILAELPLLSCLQQIMREPLVCAGHHSRCWGLSGEQQPPVLMKLTSKGEQRHGGGEQTCGSQGGGGGRGSDWEFGIRRCKLLHLEWMSNEILLHSSGKYIQPLVMEHDGG